MKKWLMGPIIICFCLLLTGTCLAAPPPAQFSGDIEIILDGSVLPLDSPVFIYNGRAMMSLEAAPGIFDCEAYAQPGEIKIICRDTFITMFPNQSNYMVNNKVKNSNIYPFIAGDYQVYIPLRTVSQELQYIIAYDPGTGQIILQSPEYQQSHPAPMIPSPTEFTPEGNWGVLTAANPLTSESDIFIAGYFTRLINSPQGRTANISLSCASINGIILQPGEVFSFNKTVGPRTVDTGYQIASIFEGKRVVNGVGGGICQTASTLYNLALESNLKIAERHPHSLQVAYIAPGRDATVAWGTCDLRFVNSFDYPVRILCQVKADLVITVLARV